MDRLGALTEAGVSIWLDTLSRKLLRVGDFARLVTGSHVTGATSNPTIFEQAITSSDLYDEQLRDVLRGGTHELRDAAQAGVDLAGITAELEREGVQSSCDAYERLLDCIEKRSQHIAHN